MAKIRARTDRHNNPTAVTSDLAKQAKLVEGVEWEKGDVFPPPSTLTTARFLGDPIDTTIKLIDRVGFYTKTGAVRWTYNRDINEAMWKILSKNQKKAIIGLMYKHEGGKEMKKLFEG